MVILDTGGGSSQFTFGRGAAVTEQFSLNVGAVRFAEAFGLAGVVSPTDLQRAMDAIGAELSRLEVAAAPHALVGMGVTGTKYAWLRHPDHFPRKAWRAFTALRTSTLKVARAWALKEAAADLWEYRSVGAARTVFRRWYFWATHARLQPMLGSLSGQFCRQPPVGTGWARARRPRPSPSRDRSCRKAPP